MAVEPLISGYSCLTLTNEASAPALACAHVRSVAAQLGFNGEEQDAIELGVEEATANVVQHAFAPDELNSFQVICRPTALGLEICIRDQGMPFDPDRLPEFQPEHVLDAPLERGLGTFLMKQVFDQVVFRNLGKDGKETCLIKHRQQQLIGDYAAPPAPSVPLAGETIQAVRPMRADEAIEIARCVYEAYGYSYPYEHIYYPERVVALNASGEISSAVAATASGKIAGHSALVYDQDGGAELAIVVTRPEYRGQGVARKLGEFLLQLAQQQGLAMVYTKAVTAHTYTQQFCHALGFSDCALLPAHAPASVQFRRIAEQLLQRESCILAQRPIAPIRQQALYLPPHHREMILALYANMGRTILCPELPPALPLTGRTELSTSASSGLDLAILEVQVWGDDCVQALRHQLIQLRRQHLAVVELVLPLWQAETARQLPALEAMGFFFTGIAPAADGKDRLLMHYLIDPAIDYANIHVHAAISEQLLAYVNAHDPNRALPTPSVPGA